MIRQKDMKIKEHFEIVNAVEGRNTSLKNEICEMKIIVKNTTVELQKIKLQNNTNDVTVKDDTFQELNKKICRLTEEKMKLKMENGNSIEDLELSKKVAEDDFLLQQEIALKTVQKLEKAMTLQKHHLSSTKRSKKLLKSMEVKLSVSKKELSSTQVKCLQNEEKLDEMKKEILRLRKESEYSKAEISQSKKHAVEASSPREELGAYKKSSNEVNLKPHVTHLKHEITELKKKLCAENALCDESKSLVKILEKEIALQRKKFSVVFEENLKSKNLLSNTQLSEEQLKMTRIDEKFHQELWRRRFPYNRTQFSAFDPNFCITRRTRRIICQKLRGN